MKVILAEDVNEALPLGIRHLQENGKIYPSRNGMILESYSPVATVYQYPSRRVMLIPEREANPFFHLFEAIWMLAGRNDLAFPQKFVQNFGQFSDDGETLNGAYGFRWRHWFGMDNLEHVIDMLKNEPTSRRAYLPMWDGHDDGRGDSLDFPCNVGAQFRLRDHVLHMTVFNRSNDIIWGAYGANYVHFGFLQEYVARSLAVYPGVYTQVSDSFHAYIDRPDWHRVEPLGKAMYLSLVCRDLYKSLHLKPMTLIQKGETKEYLDHDIGLFMDDCEPPELYLDMRTLFFQRVVCPMYRAWLVRDPSLLALDNNDWHWAGRAWLARRS